MKIEFLKAHEDRTWTTEIIAVPDSVVRGIDHASPGWDAAIINWCHSNLHTSNKYRDVVFWGIYNSNPELPDSPEKDDIADRLFNAFMSPDVDDFIDSTRQEDDDYE